ncbi:MAG: S41 family peptidase [bacterium]|nr:S41 family peptidase [bacterium]
MSHVKRFIAVFIIFLLGLVLGGVAIQQNLLARLLPEKAVVVDQRMAFVDEVYELIKKEHWELLFDEQLAMLFQKAIEKVVNEKVELESTDLTGVKTALQSVLHKQESDEKKDAVVAEVVNIVLVNLQPFGRSRLLSQADSQAILNSVTSRNPDANYFETLGVEASASSGVIAQRFKQKKQEVAKSQKTSEEKKQAQKELERAYQALDSDAERLRYAQTGVESSLFTQNLTTDIYYLRLNSFAPTTYEDIAFALKATPPQAKQTSLIIDLRGNPGGYIDGLPNVLGAFYGPGTKAYQLLKQGQKTDLETRTDKLAGLAQFKKVVILIDQVSGSSAEAMAASLKKYNVGVLVGVPTRGWGTMERLFSVSHQFQSGQTFSVLLVQHLTLREDGIPIEGSGVTPDVNITEPGWQQELLKYFNSPSLVAAVGKMVQR